MKGAGYLCARVGLFLFLSALVAFLVASFGFELSLRPMVERRWMAYAVAKYPGGTGLRMAMVHDVLLERYLVHGEAWNEERVKEARAVMAGNEGMPASAAALDAMDDLAVALIHLHREREAVAVMRKKLEVLGPAEKAATRPKAEGYEEYLRVAEMPTLSAAGHARYRAEANLGTALIHDAAAGALRGDREKQAELREGLGHIEASIGLNPMAHFGRETWQAIVVKHLLAAAEDPSVMAGDSIVGLELGAPVAGSAKVRWRRGVTKVDGLTVKQRYEVRREVAPEYVDDVWAARVGVRELLPGDVGGVPGFDEPVLGLMGMWTLGGGANANSALALARAMEDVGEREIAWDGYERAMELAGADGGGFFPKAGVAKKLAAYCRERQGAIAAAESGDAAGWEARMRERHRAELAWGERYQREYQAYEGREIAAGRRVDDGHFYDGFFAGREGIASAVGDDDQVVVRYVEPKRVVDIVPVTVLLFGVLCWVDAVWGLPRLMRRRMVDGQQHAG